MNCGSCTLQFGANNFNFSPTQRRPRQFPFTPCHGHPTNHLFVLTQVGRKLESLPPDLATATESGSITGDNVRRFAEMEGSLLLLWLLQFRGFRDPMLAGDLFHAKLTTGCGVHVIAKGMPGGWMFPTVVLILSRMIFQNEVTSLYLV
jgi:hypothetical protein